MNNIIKQKFYRLFLPSMGAIIFVLSAFSIRGTDIGLPHYVSSLIIIFILIVILTTVFLFLSPKQIVFPKTTLPLQFGLSILFITGILSYLYVTNPNYIKIPHIYINIILLVILTLLPNLFNKILKNNQILFFKLIIILTTTILAVFFLSIDFFYILNSFNISFYREILNETELGLNRLLNNIAFLVSFSLALLMGIIKFRKSKVILVLSMINILFFLIISVFTGSRQNLLFIIILFSSFYLHKRKSKKYKYTSPKIIFKRLFIIIIFIFSALVFSKTKYGIASKEIIKTRFIERTLERELEGTSPRNRVYKSALKVIEEYPILGVGPGAFTEYSYRGYYPHNTYLGIITQFGIPIFIMIVILFIIFYFNIRRKGKFRLLSNGIYYYSINTSIVIILISNNFNDLFHSPFLWVLFALLLSSATIDKAK